MCSASRAARGPRGERTPRDSRATVASRRQRDGACARRDDPAGRLRLVAAGPVGGDVVGADHPGRQFGVARLLRRRDRCRAVLPGRLQTAAAGDGEGAQQTDGRFEAGVGTGGDRTVVRLGRPGPQPRGRLRRLVGRVQFRVLGEDAGLQAAQPGARVDAEASGQQGARPAQHVEGVRLASGPVQREGEQPPGLLAPGVLGEVRVQVGYGLGGTAQADEQLRPAFDGAQPQFGEPGAFAAGPVRLAELRVGGAAPLPQRRPDPVRGPGRGSPAGLGDGRLEAPRVHGVRRGAQGVARALGDQQSGGGARRALGFQGSAQVSDERAHGSHGPRWRRVPQVLDQPGERDDPPPGHDQPGQYGAVPGAFQGERGTAALGRDRSEDTERDRFHVASALRSATATLAPRYAC